ncbi:hypothetical protein Bca4012_065955 [Brassica carinata]
MRLLRKSGLCPDRSISEYDQKNGEVPMSGRDHPSIYRSRSQPIGRWTKASSGDLKVHPALKLIRPKDEPIVKIRRTCQ